MYCGDELDWVCLLFGLGTHRCWGVAARGFPFLKDFLEGGSLGATVRGFIFGPTRVK